MLFIKWCKFGSKKVKNRCDKSRDTDNTLVIMKNEGLWGVDIEFKIMQKVKSPLKQTTPPNLQCPIPQFTRGLAVLVATFSSFVHMSFAHNESENNNNNNDNN